MTSDKPKDSLNQAKLLMQAGIASSKSGDKTGALTFFKGAAQRFSESNCSGDARAAKAWVEGTQEAISRLMEPSPTG